MKDDESKERWGQYVNMLMNKENQRVETEERDSNQPMTQNISEEETQRALKGMTRGKAVGADAIPAKTWQLLGQPWNKDATYVQPAYVYISTA